MTNSVALGRSLKLRCSVEARPHSGAVFLGLILGVVSLAGALSVIGLLSLVLPRASFGPSAAASMASASTLTLYVVAVLLGPFLELFEGQVLPMELSRRLGASPQVCVLLSGLVFGCAHYLNGGMAHGASTFVAGLVFAYGYALCRPFGWLPACLAAFTAHATHNALLVTWSVALPQWS